MVCCASLAGDIVKIAQKTACGREAGTLPWRAIHYAHISKRLSRLICVYCAETSAAQLRDQAQEKCREEQ